MRMTYSMLLSLGIICVTFLCGCEPTITNSRVHGHTPESTRVVLVLPFLDTRSITDADKNPDDIHAAEQVRRFFVEEFQKNPTIRRKIVIAPMMNRPQHSITTNEAVAYGKQYKADLVVAGQLFFYLDERGLDIPARAGMFVRMFSVPENRQVFAGEHFLKGSTGGKAAQARAVARVILSHYTDKSSAPTTPAADASAPSIMVLPFMDVSNPDNVIENTGGGAIATSLYSMELELSGKVRVLAPQDEALSHVGMVSLQEALDAARAIKADYVLRGAVFEFRRAKDQPSMLLGTYGLVVQFMIAEMSAADIACELYRVSDGMCVYATRESSRMKYRVMTEMSVRGMAKDTAMGLFRSMHAKTAVAPILEKAIASYQARATAPQKKSTSDAEKGVTKSTRTTDATTDPAKETSDRVTDEKATAAVESTSTKASAPAATASEKASASDDGDDTDEADEADEETTAAENDVSATESASSNVTDTSKASVSKADASAVDAQPESAPRKRHLFRKHK